jgi:hypothetical protein
MKDVKLMHTSFDDISEAEPFLAAGNGFVDTAVRAYKHYHLVIRPEDVWFSILVQLSLYINAHPGELRSMFVAHSGEKELILSPNTHPIEGTGAYGVDWAKFAYEIIKMAKKKYVQINLCASGSCQRSPQQQNRIRPLQALYVFIGMTFKPKALPTC